MKKVAEKYGDPEVGTLECIVRQLWIEKQDESRASAIPNCSENFLFENLKDLQSSLEVIMEFFNTVPYWRLRGNSRPKLNHGKVGQK